MTTAVAYAAAPAAAAPCPEPHRAAADARPRAGGGLRHNRPRRRSDQTVWIPEALVHGAYYNDETATVYAKVAALDARRSYPGARSFDDPCTASVAELARTCGMSESAVERGLKLLNRPGPDGSEPWLRTKQRTHTGGKGRTALRYARLVPRDEAAIEVPVLVAESLSPRRFRAYLHLARATAKGLPITGAELAGELFHHSGKSAGQPLSQKTGYRLLDDLEDLGWLTLGRRAGERARHAVTVNTHPLHTIAPAEQPSVTGAQPTPDNHDGSGPADHDGSLASKEDSNLSTDEDKAGGGIRRRRSTGSKSTAPVDNSVAATFRPAGHSEKRSNTSRPQTAETGSDLTGRSWAVLEPVRHLLPGISSWVLRRIDAEIGRQLAHGTGMERITARLTARYATTEPPRDSGRWILGAALVRHGCGLPACESGTLWHSSEPCQVCLDNSLHADPTGAQQPEPVTEEQPVRPVPEPVAAAAVSVSWPIPAGAGELLPTLSREQLQELRAAAAPDLIRQAITEHGRAHALYLYGHALVLPHLATIDDPGGNPA